jgi:hypothetical protein
MHYQLPGLSTKLDPIDKFLKEMGATDARQETSFKASGSDSLPVETEVVLLSSRE